MVLQISDDKLSTETFTADTEDGIFYIKPVNNTASLTLYFGILPGGEKMAKHEKVINIDDTDEELRGVIVIGGIVKGTRLKIVSSDPLEYAEFLQTLK